MLQPGGRLEHLEGTPTQLHISYANVSIWNKDMEKFLQGNRSHVFLLAEHRLDEAMFQRKAPLLTTWSRDAFFEAAERTGNYLWATSGGVAILPRRHLQVTRPDPDLMSFARSGHTADATARWTAAVVRLKSVSLLLVVLYLKTGEELSEFNLSILQQVFLLVSNFAGPALVMGDWQMEPHTLEKCFWIKRLGLTIMTPRGVDSTCNAGKKRMLDFVLGSN